MFGTFTRVSWLEDGVPLTGRWSVKTKAFDDCCWALNLMALCSAVSASVSSAFLIKADWSMEKIRDNINNLLLNKDCWVLNIILHRKLHLIRHFKGRICTCLSGNFGISANMSIRAAPFLLRAKYSTARCCISTSMQLSYLRKTNFY